MKRQPTNHRERRSTLVKLFASALVFVLVLESPRSYGATEEERQARRNLGAEFAESVSAATKEGCNALFMERRAFDQVVGGLRVDARQLDRIQAFGQRIEAGEQLNAGELRSLRRLMAEIREVTIKRELFKEFVLGRMQRIRGEFLSAMRRIGKAFIVIVAANLVADVFTRGAFPFNFTETLEFAAIYGGLPTLLGWGLEAIGTPARFVSSSVRWSSTYREALSDFADGYRARMEALRLPVDEELYQVFKTGNLERIQEVVGATRAVRVEDVPQSLRTLPVVRVRAPELESEVEAETEFELQEEQESQVRPGRERLAL